MRAIVPNRPFARQDDEPAWSDLAAAPASPPIASTGSLARENAAPAEPSLGGSLLWTGAVLVLAAAGALMARRLRRGAGRPGTAGGIDIVGRRPLGPRHELFVVEAEGRRFLVGASRDGLVGLGELTRIAGAAETEFRSAVRERLPSPGRGPESGPYGEIASEVEDIRKTVDRWRL